MNETAAILNFPVQEYLPHVHEELHPSVLLKSCRLRLGLTPRQAAQWLMDFNVPADGALAELLWVQMENGTTLIPAAVWQRLRDAETFRAELEGHLAKTLTQWFARDTRSYLLLTYSTPEDYILSPADRPEHWMITEVAQARLQSRYPKLLLVPFDADDYTDWRGDRPDTRALRMDWCRGHTDELARCFQSYFHTMTPEAMEPDPANADRLS